MIDMTELVRVVFLGLSALVIDDVEDAGEMIVVRARTPERVGGRTEIWRAISVRCSACGFLAHSRTCA